MGCSPAKTSHSQVGATAALTLSAAPTQSPAPLPCSGAQGATNFPRLSGSWGSSPTHSLLACWSGGAGITPQITLCPFTHHLDLSALVGAAPWSPSSSTCICLPREPSQRQKVGGEALRSWGWGILAGGAVKGGGPWSTYGGPAQKLGTCVRRKDKGGIPGGCSGRVEHSKTDRSSNFSPHTEGKHTHKKTKANQS